MIFPSSAIYFETGQRPAEKVGRAQLTVSLPSTLIEPATYLMDYAITPSSSGGVAAESCPASGGGITCVDDVTSFTASNEIFSITIDKITGLYSFVVGGRTMFFAAYPRVLESGGDHYAGLAKPTVMSYGPKKLTVYWNLTNSRVRVEHFLTIYSNRTDFLVQQRLLAMNDMSVTDLELDRFTGFDSTLSRVYGVKSGGEYDGPWSTSFPRYEPWVSAYSPTESVGMVFDSLTDSVDATAGRELVPHLFPGSVSATSVVTSNVHVVYSNSKYSARELWLKKAGLAGYTYSTGWGASPIEQAPVSFQFNLVKPQKYATLASLSFNVSYVDYSDPSNNLTCSLNGNQMFNRQTYNNTPIVAEVPYRWLNSGANAVQCRAYGTNTVRAQELNITLANMYGAAGFFLGRSGEGWTLPITIGSLSGSNSYSARVTIDYRKLGLSGFNPSSFRLVNEAGFQLPMNVSNQYVYFQVDVPACCVSPRTVYLLFSKRSSTAFFSDGGSKPTLPVAQISEFGTSPAYNISLDAGFARQLNPGLLYPNPPSRAEYLPKEVPPGVATETAKKFLFDTATARAAVIKLIVWRKA